jgi:hypothetical protein
MCTRFPTEVALQRSAGPESISVQIKMAPVEDASNDADTNTGDELSDLVSESEEATEAVQDIEFQMFPFGSQEFANEFERVLEVVSFKYTKLRSPSDMVLRSGQQ